MSGNAIAVAALARLGAAAQGEPVYEASVQLGKLLRNAFLADYFLKTPFRQELRRVLNRGEAVNALKHAIHTGRISPAQAKRPNEMQAVADGGGWLEFAGQYGDCIEHHADESGGEPLGQPAPSYRRRHHGQDRANASERDQFTRCIPVPGGAVRGRFNAVAGIVDKCSRWLKPITV